MAELADASPTKQFFIRMITRDIKLEDCIFDLVDNSLDGASRIVHESANMPAESERFKGFNIKLSINHHFLIEDDCGGISVPLAKTRAFHFGRPPDVRPEDDYLIGLYGIGMKRALFKIGNKIFIKSSTTKDAFSLHINVPAWEVKPEWNFEMEIMEPSATAGTTIQITELQDDVQRRFNDPAFKNELMRIISRDYSFFLQKGLCVSVNGDTVKALPYGFRESAAFSSSNEVYEDDGVRVQIRAGLAGIPPEDPNTELDFVKRELYGWFVVCNERVIVAADKTDRTCWGNDGFPIWHPQYNGFMGLVSFSSKDSSKLPWTTTKRDLDAQNAIYSRALAKMKLVTQKFVAYSQRRGQDLATAKNNELATKFVPLGPSDISAKELKLPTVSDAIPRRTTTIQYSRPITEVRKVAKSLGDERMSNYRVGEKTFEYYKKQELGEE
jgi:hypothetical protein